MGGVAGRRDETDRHLGEPRFAMDEPEREPLHAAGACREKAFELHEEPLRGEQQRLGLRHLRRQLEAGAELGRRGEEGARIGRAPERAVEIVEEPRAEAAREPAARQRNHVADARRADGGKRFERGGVAGHDAHRQAGERVFERGGVRDQCLAPGVREPARAARGRRRRDERGEPHARAAVAQARGDALEAAEELQAAGDFECERRVLHRAEFERDVRGVLGSPARETEEALGLLGRVARMDDELARERARRRGREPRAHAARRRFPVAGDDAVMLGDGLRLRRGKRARQRFEREVRQVQRNPLLHGDDPGRSRSAVRRPRRGA